jgi:hypothetical protein
MNEILKQRRQVQNEKEEKREQIKEKIKQKEHELILAGCYSELEIEEMVFDYSEKFEEKDDFCESDQDDLFDYYIERKIQLSAFLPKEELKTRLSKNDLEVGKSASK